MSTDFPAGAGGLAGSDVVAIAGVVALGEQEILPAVMTAAGAVSVNQTTIKVSIEKAD